MQNTLYNPEQFKDNCGFGLIAHMKGEASHKLLKTAIESLTCMTHRGGIAADGKTGDGCGLLIKKPDEFLRAVALEQGITLPAQYGVGMLFLDSDFDTAEKQKQELKTQLESQGLNVLGWRVVPTNNDCLGPMALDCLPRFEQVFVTGGEDISQQELSIKLYYARRLVEKALADHEDFYICSLSESVLSYKGLMMPVDLPSFYLDLDDPRLETAICVFHQRFSTNTAPRWPLAQPFRMLAHNGEINTVEANRAWAKARGNKYQSDLLPNQELIQPVVNTTGSDSSSMDNMLEFLTLGGMDLFRAVRIMIPPAWQNVETMDPDLRAFFEYNSMHMEAWDGPAGVVLTNGRHAVCLLDRNGLRPARWVMTNDGFITLASETGSYDYKPENVIAKGRVGPGQIIGIDTETGELLKTEDIDNRLKSSAPFKQWLKEHGRAIESRLELQRMSQEPITDEELQIHQKLNQVSYEEREQLFRPLAEAGQEATASMGDDTPMAVLSQKNRLVPDYFRQKFAQVTNPPIDPLREAIVMSLETCIGAEKNVFTESALHAKRVILSSPVLSPMKFNGLKNLEDEAYQFTTLQLAFNPESTLQQAIKDLCDQAEAAVREGVVQIILSDREVEAGQLVVPAAMATGAVNHRLVQTGLRCDSNIIVETGQARDAHQFAVLLGFGATAVYPWLAHEILMNMHLTNEVMGDPMKSCQNYRKGIRKGLFKIMSKMGISTIASYRGSQLFEAVGLSEEVVESCFNGVASRLKGATFGDFEKELRKLSKTAFSPRKNMDPGGLIKYVHGGEYHAYNPDVVQTIQRAVQTGNKKIYDEYASLVNDRPVATLRDLFGFKSDIQSIPLDQVEPVEEIFKRFDSAAMSLGALSPEAHEALAQAMNELGGRSNSGEGGEDRERFGTIRNSKIKQIASGRFGVTAEYLVNAEVLQIKVAQGAKPGEGGQLPGTKVNDLIARLRYSVPGVTLISPPPHHDIYSIEDLAQLIYDLKQVNPDALVSVKLVSEPGVGTIAAGVAKAYADLITISGYDGGTAASPVTSIKYAGSPWELGLAEAHQTLRMNDLRGQVRVQTDGGMKTGLDVVKGAILGAESFGFGTMPMVVMGCKYLRICHLNNCATGVATQDAELREQHFRGEVEYVKNYFRFVAEEVREWMAKLGVANLSDLVGRTELLELLDGKTDKQSNLDLTPLVSNHTLDQTKPQTVQVDRNNPYDKGELALQIFADTEVAVVNKTGGEFHYKIGNCDRSVGARTSGFIAKHHGNQGMADSPLTLKFEGVAGQSFGVWNAGGLHLNLEGDANDYVGKGMTGGKIVITPPRKSTFKTQETSIMGNTCLYGATGGQLLAAGRAGERFAVRNSGAHAVIEGAGDHCCEYMTGGVVTVLGDTGYNFGAGMTGGFAFVLDLENNFVDKYNHELVDIHRIASEQTEAYRNYLRGVITEYVETTNSAWGRNVLANYENFIGKFWLVKPKAADLQDLLDSTRARPE